MVQNLINFVKGDIIGASFEMKPTPITKLDTSLIAEGIWTDDTSQMLCVIDALLNSSNKEEFITIFKSNLINWFDKGLYTKKGKAVGYGSTTKNAIKSIKDNEEVLNTKLSSGALMRVAPFLFTHSKYLDYLPELIKVTHRNPEHLRYIFYYLSLYRSDILISSPVEKKEDSWIRNNPDDILYFIEKNTNKKDIEFLCNLTEDGGDTDTVLALQGALKDEEFLPTISIEIPKEVLDMFSKFKTWIDEQNS